MKEPKVIKVDRDTYELMRKFHMINLDVDVEITNKEVKEEDAAKD